MGEFDGSTFDEEGLGLTDLTEEERQDIIELDYEQGRMLVKTLCDECISSLGLDFDERWTIHHPYFRH
ncbi:MAG: DUF2757 family protein [Firmicutes bacterium]|nr:DUF2757 family protein [Bacillota bacterium]